jgi:hypothetical protein
MPQDERTPEADKEVGRDSVPYGTDERKDTNENKGAENVAGPSGSPTKSRHVRIDVGRAAAPPSWLRNVNDYVRQQPREYQVTRFG